MWHRINTKYPSVIQYMKALAKKQINDKALYLICLDRLLQEVFVGCTIVVPTKKPSVR